MLQRIQSLLLLVVVIIQILSYFLPILAWQNDEIFNASSNLVLAIFNGFIILFLIFTVFQFKKRKTQVMYVYLGIMMIVLYIAGFLYYLVTNTIQQSAVFLPFKSYGMYLLLINLVLCLIAARRIKKDDELVKSIDRIR